MNKKSICTVLFALTGYVASHAAIIGYTNAFSSAGDLTGWTSVGNVPPSAIEWVKLSTLDQGPGKGTDYNDGDLTQNLPYEIGMTLPGDGLYDDGVMRMDFADDTPSNEAIGYNLSGTLQAGETVTFSGSINGEAAYSYFYAQIWDVDADKLLVESARTFVPDCRAETYVPVDFSIEYTGQAADAGHSLQIRFLEYGNNAARDLFIDSVSVTSSIPEPASLSLVIVGAILFRWFR